MLGNIVGWVLSTNVDTLLGGVIEDGSEWAFSAIVGILGETSVTNAFSLVISCTWWWACSTGETASVSCFVEARVTNAEAKSVIVTVGSTFAGLDTDSIHLGISWDANTFTIDQRRKSGTGSNNWWFGGVVWLTDLTETIDSGISVEADTSLAIVVFIGEITVGVYDNCLVLHWGVVVLWLAADNCWFPHYPALGLEQSQRYTHIRLVFISHLARTSVPSPIRVCRWRTITLVDVLCIYANCK